MSKLSSRIALFLRSLSGGGVERVMLNLANGFADRGYLVDLVLLKAEGINLPRVKPEVRIIDLNTASASNTKKIKFPTSLQSVRSLPALTQYLRQEQPAALLSAAHFPNEIAVIAKHLARVSTRIVVSEHTTLSIEATTGEQLTSRFAPLAARLTYPFANRVVAVSKGAAADLTQVAGISPKRVQVIYNPVIHPEMLEQVKEPLDHPWFQSGEPPVILGVGRFVAAKNFSMLVRSFALLRQQRPARLILLGGGREHPQLEALAKELGVSDDVALLGFAKNPYPYMAQSAVLALTSQYEGLANVLVEAMAVGTPVVATDCKSGPAEILDSGKYGKLVPVHDDQAMADALLTTLSNQATPVDSAWLQQFTLDTVIEQYLNVLGLNQQEVYPSKFSQVLA
jgi:glycosyltransferase involved in cell wall biosynthesis